MWWSDKDYSPMPTLLRAYGEEKEDWKLRDDAKLDLEKEAHVPENTEDMIFPRKRVPFALRPQLSEWHPQVPLILTSFEPHIQLVPKSHWFCPRNASQFASFPPVLIQALQTSHKLTIGHCKCHVIPLGLGVPLYKIKGLPNGLQRAFALLKSGLQGCFRTCIYRDLFYFTLRKLDSDVVISRKEQVISYTCALHKVFAE